MDYTENWNKALEYIRSELSSQAFQTWFDSINMLSVNNDEITLEVPNRFHYEWLDSKYTNLIKEALKRAFEKPINIKYSVIINTQPESSSVMSSVKKLDELIPKKYHSASQLNRRYTFKNFIEGRGNQFAKAAASSVADSPGQTPFNPLLIYSTPGLGKTHLLQAIGNHILQSSQETKVVYVTSEKFMLDFISSIQNNKSTDFARSYRNNDVLLLDDVQFFQTKEQTQEQFFHLFNDLFQQGKQIVLTTDRHPNELTQLKQRLVSRFQSGLIVDIQSVDLETRIAILLKEAQEGGLEIPYNIVEFIATSIKDDIRAMKGALIRLLATSSLKNIDINMELAKSVLEDILGKSTFNNVTITHVIKYISREMKISDKDFVKYSYPIFAYLKGFALAGSCSASITSQF